MKQYYSRNVRVFISSTFSDMEEERNYLIYNVFPVLKEYASIRGVQVTEIDLRWGLSKEDSENGKILDLCLKEIDNCCPFFIGILGNRYGWVPEEKELFAIQNMNYELLKDALRRRLSVTEIEMRYALSNSIDSDAMLFLIKDEDENEIIKFNTFENAAKLSSLKADLLRNMNLNTCKYDNSQKLGEVVFNKLKNFIDINFPVSQDDKEEMLWIYSKECVTYALSDVKNFFQCQQNAINDVINHVLNFDSVNSLCIGVSGKRGMGKTVILCGLVKELTKTNLYNIIYLPVFKDEIFYDFEKLIDYIDSRIDKKTQLTILIIDDIDKLNIISESLLLKIIDHYNIVIMSYESEFYLQNIIELYGITYQIKDYNLSDYRKIASDQLIRSGKKNMVNNILRENSFCKCESFNMARDIVDELIKYGRYDTVNQLASELFNENSTEFIIGIIDRWQSIFGANLVRDILLSIALSQHGLSEAEIKDLFSLTQLEWSQLYCTIKKHIDDTTGYIRITDENLLSVTWQIWNEQIRIEISKRIIEYFSKRSTFRCVREKLFQLSLLNEPQDYDELYNTIKELYVFEMFKDENLLEELKSYWGKLISKFQDKTPICYINLYIQKKYVDSYGLSKLKKLRLSVYEFLEKYFYYFSKEDLLSLLKTIAFDRSFLGVVSSMMNDDYSVVSPIYTYKTSCKYSYEDIAEKQIKIKWLEYTINREINNLSKEDLECVFDACMDMIELLLMTNLKESMNEIHGIINKLLLIITLIKEDYYRLLRIYLILIHLGYKDYAIGIVNFLGKMGYCNAMFNLFRYIQKVYLTPTEYKFEIEVLSIERELRKEIGRESTSYGFMMEQFAMSLIADGQIKHANSLINRLEQELNTKYRIVRRSVNYKFTPITERNFPVNIMNEKLSYNIFDFYYFDKDAPRAWKMCKKTYGIHESLINIKEEILDRLFSREEYDYEELGFYFSYPDLAFPPYKGSELKIELSEKINNDKESFLEDYMRLYLLFHDKISDMYDAQFICDKIENGYYYFIAKNIRIYLFKIWQLLVKKNSELIQLGFLNDEKWFAYIEQNNNDNENIAMLSILSLDIFINSLLLYIEEYRLKKYPHEELLPIIKGKCRCDYGYVCF